MRNTSWMFAMAFTWVAAGCGGAALAAGQPDAPVPEGEPRETLRVKVDLKQAANCDEAFDLAVYENRGVDLVQWEASSARCTARVATIRFLPRKTSRDAVLGAARAHALGVEVMP